MAATGRQAVEHFSTALAPGMMRLFDQIGSLRMGFGSVAHGWPGI
jgi:hypothetical protein